MCGKQFRFQSMLATRKCGMRKPCGCRKRWQPRFGPMWRKNGWRKAKVFLWILKEEVVHTLRVARTFSSLFPCVTYRQERPWLKVFAVCMSYIHLALSYLMLHPPSLLFPHGHFDTTFPSAPSSSSVTRPRSAGQAHLCTSAGEFGYLADPTHSTDNEPKEFDKITSADGDTTPINDPNYDKISDFSKITRENAKLIGVSTMLEASVSHVSCGNFALQRGSQESMPRETVRQREKGEREGSVNSVTESMLKKSRRNNTRNHSHRTHRGFYSDERDLREHLERRAQQDFLGENPVQRKLYSTEYNMETQNLEQRNSKNALLESQRELEFQRRQLPKANQWADQAQRQRIHLCSELEIKNRLHQKCYARSYQEIEELKRRCFKDENEVTQQKMNECTMQHELLRDQVRNLQERLEFIEDSKIFQDPDSPSSFGSAHVSQQALITSSSRKPSRESRMQRSTPKDMSIHGNVFDCQPARRVPEELYNDSRTLATPSVIQRREGIEKSGSEEPVQSIRLPCCPRRAREKSLDDRNCLMSMTNSAAGIGTCTQSGMTIPSFPSSEMHLGKIPDHTEFESWIVNFRAEICSQAKNPTLALQWITEIAAA